MTSTAPGGLVLPPERLAVWTGPAPDPAACLGATDVIETDAPAVRDLAASVPDGPEDEVVDGLFRLVRDGIAYEMAPDLDGRDDWRATRTIERGDGFCQQKAVVLASVLRARGVPAALAFDDLWDAKIGPPLSDLLGGQVIELHGLVLAFVGGRWLRLDPSLDATLCERKAYRLSEFTPGVGACLPATDLAGGDHFRLVREVGAYADLTAELAERMLTFPALQDPAWRQHVRRRGASM